MSNANVNNVDQIRELIFGQQIKEFESRFDELSNEMKALESRLSRRLDESFNKLSRENQRATEALDQKIDDLAEMTQKDRNKLKELIDTTDEALQTQVRNLKNELLNKLTITRENMEDESGKLREELERMRREIESVLNRELTNLDNDKISRNGLAEMLLDVAMKLQGSEAQTLIPVLETEAAEGE